MAKISLRMYNREIEGLTEQQRLEEAIAHCLHILKTYPKHLETYRLLGKAYLEAKRYDQAVDIFQRILVAVPDDFVSHVGMSIIADDSGKLDDAIWHMERAFEVQPSNAAIQSELQRLFGRRDGVEPPKIRLTRGALAHMYVQGELYNQAISEIHLVLSNDPKRTDMQALLARAYFRNGQKTEATDACTELLSRYPYCLDANRLMAEILPGTQHPEAAQDYRQRVIELDPYAGFVQDSLFRSDTVADGLVTIERLDYTGQTGEMPPALGIGLESERDAGPAASRGTLAASVAAAAAAKDLPVWLTGVTEDSGEKPADNLPSPPQPGALAASVAAAAAAKDLPVWLAGTADEEGVPSMSTPAAPAQDDIPAFLRHAGWAASDNAAAAAAVPFAEEPTNDLAASGVVEGDLPDWVKALAPADEMPPSAAVIPPVESPTFTSEKSAFGAPASGDTPDWLRGLSDAETPKPDESKDLGPAAVAASAADIPDWLRDMGPASATGEVAAAASPEETPDWLKDLAEQDTVQPAVPAQTTTESDWLGALRSEQPSVPAEPAEENPAWLKEFDNDLETPLTKVGAPLFSATSEPAAPLATSPASNEPAAELGSLGTSAQEQDDAMAWLEGLAAKHGAKPEELVTDPNARTEVAPEWVDKAKEIGQQAEEPAHVEPQEDETGMWLRGLAAGAAVAAASKPEEQPVEQAPADVAVTPAPQAEVSAPPVDENKEQPPVPGRAEVPPGFEEFASESAARLDTEDIPAWLRRPSELNEELEQPAVGAPAEAEMPQIAEAAAEELPAQAAEVADLPAWLAGLDKEESPVEAPAAEPSEQLPAWLQSELEPEPEINEPAKPGDWRPVQPPVAEAAPPASEPQPAGEEPAPVAATLPATRRLVEEPTPRPAPQREPQPFVQKSSGTVFGATRSRPVSATKPATLTVEDARTQLSRGNIPAALDVYDKLIRKGKYLDDIIRDLRDALYRYPVEVPLWQSLGDAYMRANRLQEALDAYTKAEELLR